ncbi:MAG: FAD-dependent thymidylate synthase [Anaerolineae bacterium]|nr:FAD-dependent thymidylate synthase [Anaerolineae bacterium]
MSGKQRIYLLNPRQLSPETIAVTFAKTSRSPQAFDEIAAELTDESSAQFHEKWVVGYGHASVAEHAVLHLAVENTSRLAVEELESSRLASYTEKSTRYQKWDANSFHHPQEFQKEPERSLYLETIRRLFATYLEMMPKLQAAAAATHPPRGGESQAAWDARMRNAYVDVARFVLPSAALANLGITINARNLEYQLTKMYSHPLAEVNSLAEAIKKIAIAEVPTLVKYAQPSDYLVESSRTLQAMAVETHTRVSNDDDFCRLVHWDDALEERLLSAAMYRFSEDAYTHILNDLRQSNQERKQKLGAALLQNLEAHDIPRRELEHATFTFDIMLDQGAYYELKRHRMLTLTPQPLTAHLGFAVPMMIAQTGCLDAYLGAMKVVEAAYDNLAGVSPHAAAYIVPNAFNRRALVTLNLRSAIHLIWLRSSSTAHFSIRRIARRMAVIIEQKTPLLSQFTPWDAAESWEEIEKAYFLQTR